jgi:hypothetical protein
MEHHGLASLRRPLTMTPPIMASPVQPSRMGCYNVECRAEQNRKTIKPDLRHLATFWFFLDLRILMVYCHLKRSSMPIGSL